MSLQLTDLDDRRWADLVEEGRALIPVHAPEWTDHNVHDPGITLIELFAWISEMDLYWLNRIPDKHKRKFLALIGVEPEPPKPALTVLNFITEDNSLTLPATSEFVGKDPYGQPTRFRILDEINVIPGELMAVQYRDQKRFHDLTARWRRGEQIRLLGNDPQPGTELYLGFTHSFPTKTNVSLFFTFSGLKEGVEERISLIREMRANKELCRPSSGLLSCEKEDTHSSKRENRDSDTKVGEENLRHHSVHTVWEFLAGDDKWRALDPASGQIEDQTRAFTLNGRLLIKMPSTMKAQIIGSDKRPVYYIRCRFISGAYDAPPILQNLVMNGVLAEQAVPVVDFKTNIPDYPGIETRLIGDGIGRPNQRISLLEAHVLESSFRLFTKEDGKWHEWSLRADFDASARDDYHFMVDPTSGVVTFGDGEHGRVVREGDKIVVSYLATRSEEGNVAANTVDELAESLHNKNLLSDIESVKDGLLEINNPISAVGGSPAEALDHAVGRAIELIEKPRRAVTLSDVETLAKETPGIRLARVSARANIHPGFPCLKAPGIITLIVLPYIPAKTPMPSTELVDALAAYLARRKVIGTRIEVVGPIYLEVSVRVKVQSCNGANSTDIQERIKDRLGHFFHPIIGGPERKGWPFGRDVYRSEVLQVVDETPGVDHVIDLELVARDGVPQCGNICLGPTGLVESGQHQIEVV